MSAVGCWVKMVRPKRRTLRLFAHEYTHFKQGFFISTTTIGEMEAFEVQYQVLSELDPLGIKNKSYPWLNGIHDAVNTQNFWNSDVQKGRKEIVKQFSTSWWYKQEPDYPSSWVSSWPKEIKTAQEIKDLGQKSRALNVQTTLP